MSGYEEILDIFGYRQPTIIPAQANTLWKQHVAKVSPRLQDESITTDLVFGPTLCLLKQSRSGLVSSSLERLRDGMSEDEYQRIRWMIPEFASFVAVNDELAVRWSDFRFLFGSSQVDSDFQAFLYFLLSALLSRLLEDKNLVKLDRVLQPIYDCVFNFIKNQLDEIQLHQHVEMVPDEEDEDIEEEENIEDNAYWRMYTALAKIASPVVRPDFLSVLPWNHVGPQLYRTFFRLWHRLGSFKFDEALLRPSPVLSFLEFFMRCAPDVFFEPVLSLARFLPSNVLHSVILQRSQLIGSLFQAQGTSYVGPRTIPGVITYDLTRPPRVPAPDIRLWGVRKTILVFPPVLVGDPSYPQGGVAYPSRDGEVLRIDLSMRGADRQNEPLPDIETSFVSKQELKVLRRRSEQKRRRKRRKKKRRRRQPLSVRVTGRKRGQDEAEQESEMESPKKKAKH